MISDTDTLRTLPPRELSAGLAEVLKHGLIADAAYFQKMTAGLELLRAGDSATLTEAVAGSCAIKAAIVARDEMEAGERALLNLGHTFAHAIEAMTNYTGWLHGEAVGCGLVLSAKLSQAIGLLDASDVKTISDAVTRAGLPTRVEGLSASTAVETMRGDKKAHAGEVRFIVLDRIGKASQRTVPQDVLLRVLHDERLHVTHLAPYAALPDQSRGRRHKEPAPASRTEFQRDRDRIIHSTAFRRLEYKTQVFVNHEGDLFRTRLTHSLEVAQIGRAVACNLRLNEDLVEAIALAHDLGHTPFGHAGQDALNACMKPYGGFEHNLQSLRVVDELEERYAAFDGLNLTFEAREGILKHCSAQHARELGEIGERFLTRQQPSLEAQVANLADEIAYNNHDIDDGLAIRFASVGAA